MTLELEITEVQKALIDGFAEAAGRGYIFVRDADERLIATKVVPVEKSNTLMRLSELQKIEEWMQGDGFIPYVRADLWTAEHGQCAAAFHRRLSLLSRCSGDGAKNVPLKGYGMVGDQSVFYRFVEENGVVSEKVIGVKIVKGEPAQIDREGIWLATFYYLSQL